MGKDEITQERVLEYEDKQTLNRILININTYSQGKKEPDKEAEKEPLENEEHQEHKGHGKSWVCHRYTSSG